MSKSTVIAVCIFIIVLPTLTNARPDGHEPNCRHVCKYCANSQINGSDIDPEKKSLCDFSLRGCDCNRDLYGSIAWVLGVLGMILFARITIPILCIVLMAWCAARAEERHERIRRRRPVQVQPVREHLPGRPRREFFEIDWRDSQLLAPPPPLALQPDDNNPPPYSTVVIPGTSTSLPNFHVPYMNEDLGSAPVSPPPSYADALLPRRQPIGMSRSAFVIKTNNPK